MFVASLLPVTPTIPHICYLPLKFKSLFSKIGIDLDLLFQIIENAYKSR